MVVVHLCSCLFFMLYYRLFLFFFFNDTATTEIYTLSLHDALPISAVRCCWERNPREYDAPTHGGDRKSTRLNSSHANISYAVFCLKKKTAPIHAAPLRMSLLSTQTSYNGTTYR